MLTASLLMAGVIRTLIFGVGLCAAIKSRRTVGTIGFTMVTFTAAVFTASNAGLLPDSLYLLVTLAVLLSTPLAAFLVVEYLMLLKAYATAKKQL